MQSLFLTKFPVNEPPPGSPKGPLWRELPVYMALEISLKFLIKISLNKENVSFSQKALGEELLSLFPKSEASMERDAHFQSLSVSFGVPSKGLLPPGSPLERDAQSLKPSFIHLSKFLVYEPPSKIPIGASMVRDALLHCFPLISSGFDSEGAHPYLNSRQPT